MVTQLAVLGSTGSVGTQVLSVVSNFPKKFNIRALAAGNNIELFQQQVTEFQPEVISLKNSTVQSFGPTCLVGTDGNCTIASLPEVDLVVMAISGYHAIAPSIAAIQAKKNLAFASKEILVGAGELIMNLVREFEIKLLPIDSEPSAIYRCINKATKKEIKKLILTCSGGPFLGYKKTDLQNVSIENALNHPSWKMGQKISIESATLMNKGFEAIQLMHYFDLPISDIEIVVHPQALIHSAVEFVDGSIIALLSKPDLRLPIQHALFDDAPIQPNGYQSLSLFDVGKLEFERPDLNTFKCLNLALQAAKQNDAATLFLSAANDIAVEAFLNGQIGFLDIANLVEQTLDQAIPNKGKSVDEMYQLYDLAYRQAKMQLKKICQ